jgi:hypothetical protein
MIFDTLSSTRIREYMYFKTVISIRKWVFLDPTRSHLSHIACVARESEWAMNKHRNLTRRDVRALYYDGPRSKLYPLKRGWDK